MGGQTLRPAFLGGLGGVNLKTAEYMHGREYALSTPSTVTAHVDIIQNFRKQTVNVDEIKNFDIYISHICANNPGVRCS